jgi:predicted lipoprotein with Yx(FWY)xxD motif
MSILVIVSFIAASGMQRSYAADHRPDSITITKTSIGPLLADKNGMTLYIFDKDQTDQSVCYGKCAKTWPILIADENAMPIGDFDIIIRKDDIRQWTYKGQPLYLWHKDKKTGDITGDNVRDIWHVISVK